MYFDLADLLGCRVQAADRPSGTVEDVYVDDVLWTVRHVAVADAGGLGTQAASVDPAHLGNVDLGTRTLTVSLTHDQVSDGPDISSDLPVSRQTGDRTGDPHLRSVKELSHYQLGGLDGPVGRLVALIVDDETWKIHFAVAETGEWNGNRTVLLAPGLLNHVDREGRSIHLDLDRTHVAKSPDYHPGTPIRDEADIKLVGRVGI